MAPRGVRTGVASGCRRPPASFAGSRGEVCTAIGADGGIRPLGAGMFLVDIMVTM